VKVPVLDPLGMVTVGGTETPVEPDERLIVVPPAGDGRFRLTVPIAELPPMSELGETTSPDSSGVSMLSDVVKVLLPCIAEIVAVTLAVTAVVLIVKLTVCAPAGTVTFAGNVAEELEEVKLTVVPPFGANPLRVTVPVRDVPPTTVDGVSETEVRTAAVIAKVEVFDTEP